MDSGKEKTDIAAQLLVDHYHRTYDLTHQFWQQRNKIFLLLLGTVSLAAVLTFRAREANPLLVHLIAGLMGVTDPASVAEIRGSFPFGVLQSALLLVIFYLMVNLYHRATDVIRNYQYLGWLEKEIRLSLKLDEGSVAFTREGRFYTAHPAYLQKFVKWIYILFLGALLLAFLGRRTVEDYRSGDLLLAGVDAAISLATLLFFFAYARSSVVLDLTEAKEEGEARPAVHET